MSTLDPFRTDPVYEAIRASARAKRRAERLSTSQQIAGVGSSDGGEGAPTADAGVEIRGPVSTMTVTSPNLTPEPTYGVTRGYGTAQRIGEGVGANLPAIVASAMYETTDPLKGAAVGTLIDSIMGDTPGYLAGPNVEGGVRTQVSGFDPTKTYGQFADGRIAEVTAEDIATGGFKTLTAAEAARQSPMGYVGADPRTPLGAVAYAAQTMATSLVPFSGVMFGKVVESPVGTPMAIGSTPFGPGIVDRVYETHGNIMNGIPGNFGMKIGNQYVTYNANDNFIGGDFGKFFGIKEAKTAGMNMTTEQFQNLYAANYGFDPRSVDWQNSTPGELKGDPLDGFVSGVGGFTGDGLFVDSSGRMSSSQNMSDINNYSNAAMRDSKTAAAAAAALERQSRIVAGDLFFGGTRQKTYEQAASELRARTEAAVAQTQANYPGMGMGRPSAADVPVGSVADALLAGITGPKDIAGLESLGIDVGFGISDTGFVQTLPGYTSVGPASGAGASGWRTDPVTGNRYNFNLDQPSKAVPGEVYFDDGGSDAGSVDRGQGYDPGFDEGDTGDTGGPSDTSGGYGSDPSGGAAGSPFAEGGFVTKKAVGGPVEQAGVGPVGFVNGKAPEQVTEQKAIADDVEGQVPEGTFVINAPAVERAGSSDIRKMLVKAIEEAKAQGIDLSGQGVTIDSEEAVSVAVSEGEVLVPPVLARIIGYDRLEKINKRGEAEVQRRAQEAEQQQGQQPQMPMMAQEGGFVQKKADGGKVDPRRVLPVSDFKSYNTGDSGRDFLNWVENTGATILGKREEMQKAFSYARNYARNNQAEDQYEDTMRHVLLGGLYAGGPDDSMLEKVGSKIASGFADYKEKGAVAAENIEPVDRFESAIDLNNNQYGRALRKAAGDEEAFVGAVEKLMDRIRSGQEAPRLKNEDGKEITIVTSTADGRSGFLRRED